MKKLLAMLLALVMAVSMLSMTVFAEPGDTPTEDEETGDIDVVEPTPDEEEDTNPDTGIVFALIPMVLAGAAVAVAKKH